MTMSGPPECEYLTSSCSCWNVVTDSCGGPSPGMQGDPSRQNGGGGLRGDKEASSERGESHGGTSGPAQYEAGS